MSHVVLQRFAVAVLVALPFAGSACINVFGTNSEGDEVDAEFCTHRLAEVIADPGRKKWIAESLRRAEQAMAADPSVEHRNDFAAALLHAGEFQRAHDLLVALEHEKPGSYQVAANLGTAYDNMQDPAKTMMGVGGMYEDLYGRTLNDQLRIANEQSNAPLANIQALLAAANGGGQYSTNTQTAQGPSNTLSNIAGAGLGAMSMGTNGGSKL